MKKFLLLILLMLFVSGIVYADKYNPDFGSFKTLYCEISETIYNSDNSVLSKTGYHRLFHVDDADKILFINKEPVDGIISYDENNIRYRIQTMSDDYIKISVVNVDRVNMTYSASADITYDNPEFGVKTSKSEGVCKFLD